MPLPKYGVQATVENLPGFSKAMDTIDSKIKNASKSSAAAAKQVDPFSKALDKAGKSVESVTDKLQGFLKQNVPFGNALSGIIDKLGAIPLPALAAAAGIAAIAGAVVGFVAIASRGAPLQEIAVAFDNLTASVGLTSQTLLKDLRAASEGTIADFDLIKTASTALLGVSGEFGKAFGQALPEFLKIAKVEADATGRSVNELFNAIVEGVKKGTPKLIESTGLVIDQKKAYQDYADQLGITVAQLSDADRSMALLNATLTAGAQAIDTLGGAQESNADKLDRISATITNVFDGLAVSVQPVFGQILDGVQTILNVFAGFAPYLSIVFNFVGKIIAGIVKFIGSIIPPDLPKRLFEGAAAAFGSFANAIIQVANKLIFPAVIGIAKFIADFLIGFSPPKEGPLSTIDKGGQNVMLAWLEGFSGVSLDPVQKVAAEVSQALGKIGGQSLDTVNKRLAQLDKALLPFQNRLDIIKAQFDALNEPAQLALDAIDRQSQALQDAVAQGDPAAAERLRQLDMARDSIQSQVDAQQKLVDGAQIQLALMKAQQGPERALLTIRQAYLLALAKAQAKTGGAGAAATPKTGGAGAINTPTPGGAAPIGGVPGVPSVQDIIGGNEQIDAALQGITEAFSGQIDTTGLADFNTNIGDLQTQFDRINSVDLGGKLKSKFKFLTDIFDPSVDGSPANILNKLLGNLTGPPEQAGSIASFFQNIQLNGVEPTVKQALTDFGNHIFNADLEGSPANKIRTAVRTLVADKNTDGSIANFISELPQHISDLQADISKAVSDLGLADLFNPDTEGSPANLARNAVQTLTADASTEGSIPNFFAQLGPNLATAGDSVAQWLRDNVVPLFDPNIEDSPAFDIVTLVKNLTGDQEAADSVASFFADLPTNISNAIPDLLGNLKTNIFDPVSNFLTGSGEGTFQAVLASAVSLIGQFPANVVEALRNFGGMIYNAIVVPIINVLNSGIAAMETGIRNIATFFANFLGDIINKFDTTEIAGTNLGGLVPQGLRDFQAALASAGTGFTIGRISTELPAFLQPPGGAAGGLFGPGLMKVGERGPELMFNAAKMGVLPNQLVSVLGDLSRVLAQPQPMPVYAGNSYQDNHSMNMTFNGVQGSGDVMRRMALLRARAR